MNIMSIRDIKSVSMDTTLSELGMDSLMAVEIKQTLEREFELFLSPQDLRSLTFMKLQEYSENREAAATSTVKLKLASDETPTGMAILLRNMGDEVNSEQTILRVRSQNDSENYASCVLITPGVEGVAGNAWHAIGAELAMPVYILQLTKTVECESTPEIVGKVFDVSATSLLEIELIGIT
jgi:fatty acid synthase, animal type